MPLWMQHIVVLTLVGLCVAYAGYQGFRTLRGRKGGLGNCCAKGCDGGGPAKQGGERIHFLPSEMLRKRR